MDSRRTCCFERCPGVSVYINLLVMTQLNFKRIALLPLREQLRFQNWVQAVGEWQWVSGHPPPETKQKVRRVRSHEGHRFLIPGLWRPLSLGISTFSTSFQAKPLCDSTNNVPSPWFFQADIWGCEMYSLAGNSQFSGGHLLYLPCEFFKKPKGSPRPRETILFHKSDGEVKVILMVLLFPLFVLLLGCYRNRSCSHDWPLLTGYPCWSRVLGVHGVAT